MSEKHLAVPGGIIVVEVPDDAPDTGDGSSWLHRFLNMGGRVVRIEPRTTVDESAREPEA